MTKLDDLPSLGGLGAKRNVPSHGFDDNQDDDYDFDLGEDKFGDSSNKFEDAERHL